MRLVGGTFHSFAHQTLRRYAAQLALPEGFSVIDAADAADVFDLVREEHGWAQRKDRRYPRKGTLLNLYSRAVNAQQRLSEVIAADAPWALDVKDDIADVCRGYVERKRALGLLDFDDLLLWHRAALLDDVLGPRLAGAFDQVLVDEYQDVNDLQVDLLQALRRDDTRVTVICWSSTTRFPTRTRSSCTATIGRRKPSATPRTQSPRTLRRGSAPASWPITHPGLAPSSCSVTTRTRKWKPCAIGSSTRVKPAVAFAIKRCSSAPTITVRCSSSRSLSVQFRS
jgi:hypothetical protein